MKKLIHLLIGPFFFLLVCIGICILTFPNEDGGYCEAIRCSTGPTSVWSWKHHFHYFFEGLSGRIMYIGSAIGTLVGVFLAVLGKNRLTLGIQVAVCSTIVFLTVLTLRAVVVCWDCIGCPCPFS